MNFVMLTFDQDHTHAGQSIRRGEKREIPAHHADWLIEHGVAHITPSSTSGKSRRADPQEDSDHVH